MEEQIIVCIYCLPQKYANHEELHSKYTLIMAAFLLLFLVLLSYKVGVVSRVGVFVCPFNHTLTECLQDTVHLSVSLKTHFARAKTSGSSVCDKASLDEEPETGRRDLVCVRN